MDRATTIGSRPPVNFNFSHSLEQPCEKGTELNANISLSSLSLSFARITLHRVDTNRAAFDPECYPINVKTSPFNASYRDSNHHSRERDYSFFSAKQTRAFFLDRRINVHYISKLLFTFLPSSFHCPFVK